MWSPSFKKKYFYQIKSWNSTFFFVPSVLMEGGPGPGGGSELRRMSPKSQVFFYALPYVSASGMNFLFMGVSSVTGRMPSAQELVGRPDPEAPSKWTLFRKYVYQDNQGRIAQSQITLIIRTEIVLDLCMCVKGAGDGGLPEKMYSY